MRSLEHRLRFRWWWIPLAFFACVYLLYSTFTYSSLCRTCGMTRNSRQFLGIQILTVSKTAETPLSRFVHANHMETGPHDWLFCHGSGNGVMCAIGPGRYFGASVESEQTVALLDAVRRFYSPATAKLWLEKLIDPTDRNRLLCELAVLSDVPAAGFPDRQSFDQWWASKAFEIENCLQDHPELDLHRTPANLSTPTTAPHAH